MAKKDKKKEETSKGPQKPFNGITIPAIPVTKSESAEVQPAPTPKPKAKAKTLKPTTPKLKSKKTQSVKAEAQKPEAQKATPAVTPTAEEISESIHHQFVQQIIKPDSEQSPTITINIPDIPAPAPKPNPKPEVKQPVQEKAKDFPWKFGGESVPEAAEIQPEQPTTPKKNGFHFPHLPILAWSGIFAAVTVLILIILFPGINNKVITSTTTTTKPIDKMDIQSVSDPSHIEGILGPFNFSFKTEKSFETTGPVGNLGNEEIRTYLDELKKLKEVTSETNRHIVNCIYYKGGGMDWLAGLCPSQKPVAKALIALLEKENQMRKELGRKANVLNLLGGHAITIPYSWIPKPIEPIKEELLGILKEGVSNGDKDSFKFALEAWETKVLKEVVISQPPRLR
ncbi:MAG: hypothetical protein PHT54_01950 [Candidatus Nanoarchaeia archaeon]|nr:hypothetical protein [Candidatus Nanoarchaeia archaeon]